MIRLFVAMPLSGDVELKLGQLIAQLKSHETNRAVKWVPAQNVHLTLKFLGDTEESLVNKISAEIDSIAASFLPIDAVVDQVGGFPNLKRPRVLWTGCSGGVGDVPKIAKQVDLAMLKLRFEKEKRPFKSHLTLGRVRQGGSIDDLAAYLTDLVPESIPVHLDRITLFRSTLTQEGALYERLHEAVLQSERFSG